MIQENNIENRVTHRINGISQKLEKFIDHADTKFDLAGEMFDKLQKQIKELEATLFKAVSRNTELINELDDKTKELEKYPLKSSNIISNKLDNKISALNAKNQKRADGIKILDDKIAELDDKIKGLEQKANRTGQFHLDAVNEKIH